MKMLTIFLMFLCVSVLGQHSSASDSLYKILYQSKDSKERVRILSDICWTLRHNNPSRAIIIADSTIILAQKNNYTKSISTLKKIKGIALQNTGNFNEALEIYYQLLQNTDSIKDRKEYSDIFFRIAGVYKDQKMFLLAIHYYNLSLQSESKINTPESELSGHYNNLGVVYGMMGKSTEAIAYFKRANNTFLSENNYEELARNYTNFAIEYDKLNKVDTANIYFEKALALYEKIGDSLYLAIGNINIGAFLSKQHKYNIAKKYLERGLNISKNIDYKSGLSYAYAELSGLYFELNDYKQAYTFQKKYHTINDALQSEENIKKSLQLQNSYKNEKHLRKIEALTKDDIINKLQIREKNNQIVVLIILFFALIGLTSGLLAFIKLRQKNKLNCLIQEQNEKTTKLIFQTQENEQKKISCELHDNFGSLLVAIKCNLDNITHQINNDKELKTSVLKTISLVDDIYSGVRQLSHQTMPDSLVKFGLTEAFADLLELTLKKVNIEFEFEHFNITERYAEAIEIGLYRMMQEIINNIIKHSKATQVKIQLYKTKGVLLLIVEDNGIGLSEESTFGHGLSNISARLVTLKGELNIQSGLAKGTILTIKIPSNESN